MSNLSVRQASEAMIGIACLRNLASTPKVVYSIDSMADEMLGSDSKCRSVRVAIKTLVTLVNPIHKERGKHESISDRVNATRDRELSAISYVHGATLATLHATTGIRNNDTLAISELQEKYVLAMQGIDKFPMGTKARKNLRSQLESEATLAVPEANRLQVAALLVQAEHIHLKRYADSVYALYEESEADSAQPM